MRQRECLKRARHLGILTLDGLCDALAAPVFVMSDIEEGRRTESEISWIEQHLCHYTGNLKFEWSPYPCFRLCLPDSWFSVWVGGDATRALLWLNGDKIPAAKFKMGTREGRGCVDFWLYDEDGSQVAPENLSESVAPEEREMFAQRAHSNICQFLLVVSSKAASTLRVREDKPDKSAEWHLAREHYLILPRSQAQRISKARRGVSHRDMQLAAHWRRAHFRRLTSDKFTRKKNSVIPVKQAWVGPKEWVGLDRKIYKVVE